MQTFNTLNFVSCVRTLKFSVYLISVTCSFRAAFRRTRMIYIGLGQYAFPNQFDSSRELQVKTGKLTSKDQYYYFGQLEEDTNKWDGVGICVESNGSIYEGYFNNDKLNGFGRYIYFKGDYYIGEWSDGCRHGQGTYCFAGGRRYVGGWKNNTYHGIGTEYSADGQISREGVWENGDYIGRE